MSENKFAIMPLKDYSDACQVIRDKTGINTTIVSGELSAKVEDVYNAGYDAGVENGSGCDIDESKIIEATAEGIGYVDIYDVSEFPHDITIQIPTHNVDLTELKVKQLNSNLCCDFKNRTVKDVPYQNTTLRQWDGKSIVLGLGSNNATYKEGILNFSIDEENDSITFTGTNTIYGVAVDIPCFPNEALVVRWNSDASFRINIIIYDEVGNVVYANASIITSTSCTLNISPPENARWAVASFAPTDAYVNTPITIKGIWSHFKKLEINTYPPEKEPYVETEYTSDENGVISGIKSMSPNITFIPSKYCDLSVDYRKSWGMQTEHERFWESYQTTSDMPYAFAGAGWNERTFRPTKPIIPFNATQMFVYHNQYGVPYDFVEHCKKHNIVMDLTNCGYAPSLFQSAYISRVGKIDLPKVINTYTFSSLFNGSQIETIDEFVFYENHPEYDGNMFKATNLKNFTATGTIAKNGLNFSYSPLLTHESLMSIINALADKTGSSGFTVTLGATNLAKLTDAEKSIATEKGWTLV